MGISCEGNWGLFYFGDHCPAYKMMTMLPENTTWKVDIIDTGHDDHAGCGVIQHGDKLDLPAKPWIALRLIKL